jgi:uncharacterized SAM-binding protein YcdF (DUF218 family)
MPVAAGYDEPDMYELPPSASAATSVSPGPSEATRPRLGHTALRIWQYERWTVKNLAMLAGLLLLCPVQRMLARRLKRVQPPCRADWIVLLGGDSQRAIEVARLWREGWAPRVACTSYHADARRLGRLLVRLGVVPEAVHVDPGATRTADHPRTLAEIEGVDPRGQKFLVVTSPLHTARAGACFRRAGYRCVRMHSPAWQDRDRRDAWRQGWASQREWLFNELYELWAWAVYRLRGWV